MTIILITLVQALPVWIVAVIFKNRTFVTLSAIFMALLAVATGSAAFVLVDLFGIGIAYWIGLSHIASHRSTLTRDCSRAVESASTSVTRSGGAVARKAPSDFLNLPDDAYVASVKVAFDAMNENALIMTLVAYANQEVLLRVIEDKANESDELPKSLEALIRVTDPFVNDTPDEVASARRYWFTMAGLLLRAERMATIRMDASDVCISVWIRIVRAARLIPDVLRHNQLWSDEEKHMLTLGLVGSSEDSMRTVHDLRVPEFVRHDPRMKKVYFVAIRGMKEEEWDAWQAEKKA